MCLLTFLLGVEKFPVWIQERRLVSWLRTFIIFTSSSTQNLKSFLPRTSDPSFSNNYKFALQTHFVVFTVWYKSFQLTQCPKQNPKTSNVNFSCFAVAAVYPITKKGRRKGDETSFESMRVKFMWTAICHKVFRNLLHLCVIAI